MSVLKYIKQRHHFSCNLNMYYIDEKTLELYRDPNDPDIIL